MIVEERYERILKALDKGSNIVSKLLKEVGGSATTLEHKLNVLIDGNFVRDEKSDKFPFKRLIFLTEKGSYVLGLLKEGKI